MTLTEELGHWVRTNCPTELIGSTFKYGGGSHQAITDPAYRAWFDACVDRGFTVPDWPKAYGGLVRINTLFHHSEKYRHPWEVAFNPLFPRLYPRVE